MSALLSGRVYYTNLPAHLKLTLLALADEADDEGRGIFLGQKRLARKCGTKERATRGNLARLRELGYIERLPVRHPTYATDQYEINTTLLPHSRDISEPPADIAGRQSGAEPERQQNAGTTGNPLPPTREIPVRTTPKGAESKSAPNGQVAPTGDETYLLEQLHRDPRWGPVTHGAIVALNRSYGRGVVTIALQRAVEETRDNLEIRSSPYGLLEAMCKDVAS